MKGYPQAIPTSLHIILDLATNVAGILAESSDDSGRPRPARPTAPGPSHMTPKPSTMYTMYVWSTLYAVDAL